jgi:hypothetical protein
MTISIPFDWGDTVYIKTDVDQRPRQISEINVKPPNCVVYSLSCGAQNSDHYEFEISKEKDFIITTTD